MTTGIPADSQNALLKDKQYADLNLGDKGLKVPSMALVDLVISESNFRKNMSAHSWDGCRKLFTSSMVIVSECRGVCDTKNCKKSLIYMVRLYMDQNNILCTQN